MRYSELTQSDRVAILWLIGIAFVLIALMTKTHTDSCNDFSRVAAIESLSERHTFAIDGSPFAGTCDKYRYAGHFYSDKEPLLLIMGALVAYAIQPLHISLTTNFSAAYYTITLFTVGLSFVVAVVYAYVAQRVLGFSQRIALSVSGLMTFASPLLTWATVLANHVPCGAAALAGATHGVLAARGSRRHAAISGIFLSLAIAFDAAAAVFLLVPILLTQKRSPTLWLPIVLGAAPLLIFQAAFNLVYSGSLLPAAMNGAVWNYPGSIFAHHYLSWGMLGSIWAYIDYAKYLTIGDKGLITYSPLVLVAVYGLYLMRYNDDEQRRLSLAIIASTALFLIATLLFTDDHSAANYGERRYVDFIPLLCVGLGPMLAALRGGYRVGVVRVIVILGILMQAVGTVSPWTGAPGFLWNIGRFHALWTRAPIIGSVDILLTITIMLLSIRVISTKSPLTPLER
jgi:hypothetical protein